MSRRSKSKSRTGSNPKPAKPVTAGPGPGPGPKLGLLRLARLQLMLALGISLYLAYTALSSGAVAGCGAGSDCNTVLSSRWAYWFNLPVSLPAAGFYLLLLTASFLAAPARPPATQRRAWSAMITGAFIVLGAALWFIGLQAAILGSWCTYCLAAHFLGGTGAVLLLVAAPLQLNGPDGTSVPFGVPQRTWPALLGIAALLPLVAGQFLSHPPASSLDSLEVAAGETTAPATTNAPAAVRPSRIFSVHQGRFPIDLYEAPLIGSPDAPSVVVSLFDYTCEHCRKQHGQIKRVQKRLGNQVTFILLPMPLDKSCNPLLTQTPPDHANACEYTRINLAVWRAKPEVFAEYEEWFFEPERPRPVAEVLAYASRLTGRNDLEELGNDPWIADYLAKGQGIFKENWERTTRNMLPMLMIGGTLSSGSIETDLELHDILVQHLGLQPAPVPAQ